MYLGTYSKENIVENEKDKIWGKTLTGGLACAVMLREIVIAVPETALWAIGGITLIALVYMGSQVYKDTKKKP